VRVDLVRHAQTVAPPGGCVGARDVALSEEGVAASRRAAVALRACGYARVVSSDLHRCRVLARSVDAASGADPRLREQSFGAWEGRAWSDLQREDPAGVAEVWRAYAVRAAPGGETLAEVQQRAIAAVEDAARGLGRDERLLLVTHAGVIRALACAWMGVPLDQALRWSPSHLGCARFVLDPAGAVLEGFNLAV
jgi:alpha-ribazole phosphatase